MAWMFCDSEGEDQAFVGDYGVGEYGAGLFEVALFVAVAFGEVAEYELFGSGHLGYTCGLRGC